MARFQPSTPQHLARHNEAEKSWYEKPLWQTFSDWWNTPSTPAGPPPKPPTADGIPVAKGTKAYAAIFAELEKKYGKYPPANATGYRDAVGDGNYVYRQYSDGRIFIQKSGQGSAPVPPRVVDAKSGPTTGGGLPPWVLPVGVVGGAAVIGLGVFFVIKRKKGKR